MSDGSIPGLECDDFPPRPDYSDPYGDDYHIMNVDTHLQLAIKEADAIGNDYLSRVLRSEL